MSTRPILIVEHNSTLRAFMAVQIALEGGFTTDEAGSAAEAEQMLSGADARYDAILLDVRLPDADGREFCAKLRREGCRTPVIMLSGAITEADVVSGLDSGANDYVIKPFRVPEVMARIRAQLRVHDASVDAVFLIGPYVFRPSSKLMLEPHRKRKVQLTEKECRIIRCLYDADGDVVQRGVLLNKVWGYNSSVTTHTLETHIYRLRQKLEDNPSKPSMVFTVHGGYRLDRYGVARKEHLTGNTFSAL